MDQTDTIFFVQDSTFRLVGSRLVDAWHRCPVVCRGCRLKRSPRCRSTVIVVVLGRAQARQNIARMIAVRVSWRRQQTATF